jgi:hypothetical protein
MRRRAEYRRHLRIGVQMIAFSVGAALVVGFIAGLLTFKAKQRWCERCGCTLSCQSCLGAAAARVSAGDY